VSIASKGGHGEQQKGRQVKAATMRKGMERITLKKCLEDRMGGGGREKG